MNLNLFINFLIHALLFGILSLTVAAQNQYVAHRGVSSIAPENTIAAVKLAWESGADAAEVDVRLSADHRVMVVHDASTKRTSNGKVKLRVSRTHSGELRKIDVGIFKGEEFAGEPIPFIEEILETVPEDKTLYIEIKCGPEILPALEKAIEESGKKDQIVFISFGWKTILETKTLFPDNNCYYLKMFPVLLTKKMKETSRHGLNGINLHHRSINRKVLRRARKMNLEVMAWTVDDPKVANKLQNKGVSTITTNRPAYIKETIESQTN
jgi:glycerophosphoryl diester phosphodiesterase